MSERNKVVTGLSVVVLIFAVLAGFLAPSLFNRAPSENSESLLSSTINKNAKVSAEGYPLPSDAKEDVLITVNDTGNNAEYSSATVLYDYDTGEWEAAITDQLGLINIVKADQGYYVLDLDSNEWFEISEAEANDVFDINAVYFDESYVDSFLSASTFLSEAQCASSLCATWQVVLETPSQEDDSESVDTLTIRVDNGTRKIYDITAVGESTSFTLSYIYQDVDIEVPSPLAPDSNIEIINLDENGNVIPEVSE